MITQKWRIYAPEGRDTSFDVKMNLRNFSNYGRFLGRGETFVTPVSRDDYGDDTYKMQIKTEEIDVVARERGQRTKIKGVFDELDSGIFFRSSDENASDAEAQLVKAFF